MKIIGTVAPAKINLGLQVLRRREDGFHDLNTVFYRLPIGDRLLVGINGSTTISVQLRSTQHIPLEENLVYKAARLLQTTAGVTQGAHIVLEKVIPSGAGLGGGSSDAASTLLALRELWQADIDDAALHRLGAQLGSDVPFFLQTATAAVATGRGEILEPASIALPYHIVVVHPGIHVSTPWAYRQLNRTTEQPAADFISLLAQPDPKQLQHFLVNDFEAVVFAEYPVVAAIRNTLYDEGAVLALLSGSGSAVFGLFETGRAAQRAAEFFATETVFVCSPDKECA